MKEEHSTKIFISYRRDDTDLVAENIYHHLKDVFGHIIFKDNLRIGPGQMWNERILEEIESAEVVFALIGQKWFIQDNDHCIRLEAEDDWVRKEIEYSLLHDKHVIPVLIDGTSPPTVRSFQHLPILAEKFPFIQAISLNSRRLKEDLALLISEYLPSFGITSIHSKPWSPLKEIDILADYPLPLKPNISKLPSPYVGLRPFTASESFLFFGRDLDILSLIKKLETQLEDKKIILYHGRSGVGKSSLLTAGLYPRLKKQGWDVSPPRRRSKDTGLAKDLENLLVASEDSFSRLFVLDQVEEMYTNPCEEPNQEISDFQQVLINFRENYNNACLVLSFRSDYFTNVRKLLDDKSIPYDEMELFPLDQEGILKAITGIMDKPDLKEFYKIHFDPPNLPNEIRDDVCKDKNSSHITTLLQYQLAKLFSLAAPDWANNHTVVHITKQHYTKEFKKESLEGMLDVEFDFLKRDWPEQTTGSLVLDVLNQFITDQATAGNQSDADILELYGSHIAHFADFYDYLKNKRSLLIWEKTEGTFPSARLAHDSLGPLLLTRFRTSDAPAQQAYRIFESKKYKDINGTIQYKPIEGKADIEILKEARSFMYRWSEKEEAAFEKGRIAVEKAQAELKIKNDYIFNTLVNNALNKIEAVEFVQALYDLKAAMEAEAPIEHKRERFENILLQQVFFLNATGLHQKEMLETLHLLSFFPRHEIQSKALNHILENKIVDKNKICEIIKMLMLDEDDFNKIIYQFYPKMMYVRDGIFKMGSTESKSEFLHEVSLNGFEMASTPVTFYQFGLYCAATGRNIAAYAPPWGKKGFHPVVSVSWDEANEYLKWLDEQDSMSYEGSGKFRLPTEAEWEYAARGGNEGIKDNFIYAGSNDLDAVGWFWQNSGRMGPLEGDWGMDKILRNMCETHPVGTKQPNQLGLYDMSGNVWEWCQDWYSEDYYENSPLKNPVGPEPGVDPYRVVRGGCWRGRPHTCRVACRPVTYPDYRLNSVGFRPLRTLSSVVHQD